MAKDKEKPYDIAYNNGNIRGEEIWINLGTG